MAFEYLIRDHKLEPEEIRVMLKDTIVRIWLIYRCRVTRT